MANKATNHSLFSLGDV